MLLGRAANTGTTPRAGHPRVITVAELLGRDSATTVRYPAPASEATTERRRGGPWVNKATVATAVVTFGSVLAVGSTFLPHSHPAEEPGTGPSTDVPITEALSAKPPSAAPVAKPATGPRPAATPAASGSAASVPAAATPAAPGPAAAGPAAAGPQPTRLPGSAAQSRPLTQLAAPPQPRSQPRPSGPARHAAPRARAAQGTVPSAAGGSAKSSKSTKTGKSGKSGAHRSSAQRPATEGKAATEGQDAAPSASSAHAAAPRSGLGGVVSGLSGGLL
jgi:hypothetical protein